MRRKPRFFTPWAVLVSWNFPKEVFDCFKVVISSEENSGYVVKTTRCVEQIHMVNMDKLQHFFFALANKYAKSTLDERHILVKEEKDGSYSRVIEDEDHPAVFKYSKNTEML